MSSATFDMTTLVIARSSASWAMPWQTDSGLRLPGHDDRLPGQLPSQTASTAVTVVWGQHFVRRVWSFFVASSALAESGGAEVPKPDLWRWGLASAVGSRRAMAHRLPALVTCEVGTPGAWWLLHWDGELLTFTAEMVVDHSGEQPCPEAPPDSGDCYDPEEGPLVVLGLHPGELGEVVELEAAMRWEDEPV